MGSLRCYPTTSLPEMTRERIQLLYKYLTWVQASDRIWSGRIILYLNLSRGNELQCVTLPCDLQRGAVQELRHCANEQKLFVVAHAARVGHLLEQTDGCLFELGGGSQILLLLVSMHLRDAGSNRLQKDDRIKSRAEWFLQRIIFAERIQNRVIIIQVITIIPLKINTITRTYEYSNNSYRQNMNKYGVHTRI